MKSSFANRCYVDNIQHLCIDGSIVVSSVSDLAVFIFSNAKYVAVASQYTSVFSTRGDLHRVEAGGSDHLGRGMQGCADVAETMIFILSPAPYGAVGLE